jgi:hypothetical protein
LWNLEDIQWQENFIKLKEYISDNVNPLVPLDCITENGFNLKKWITSQNCITENGFNLRKWTISQCNEYKNGTLQKGQQKMLEQLSRWVCNREKILWKEGFDKLQKYIESNTNTNISLDCIASDGFKLGLWVSAQRNQYEKGNLSEERQKALETLPGWAWDLREEIRWQEGYAKLKQYCNKYGTAQLKSSYKTERGFNLGLWVSAQRSKYKKGNMSKERQQALEVLPGWVWDKREKRTQDLDARLREYLEKQGSTQILSSFITNDGCKHGQWVITQQSQYKKGDLTRERQQALEALPGWVRDVPELRWLEWYARLKEYIEKQGSTQIPSSFITNDGYKLGQWVETQRKLYKSDGLLKERQILLELLPGWIWESL